LIFHLLACAIPWGASFLFLKLLAGGLPAPVIASLRALIAMAAMAALVVALRGSLWPRGRELRDWAVLGAVNGAIPNVLVVYALERMDSGPAALIQVCGPIMTAILAHFLLAGERLNSQRIAGIAIGFAGVCLLIGPSSFAGGGQALAVAAMLVLTLGYAIGNVYTRTIPTAEPIRLALGQQTASAVFSTAFALAVIGPAGYANAGSYAGPLVAVGVVSTALPIWMFMRLIRAAGPTRAAMVGYLAPLAAVIIGIVVLGEPADPVKLAGGVIVMIGVAVVTGMLPWHKAQRRVVPPVG
jgi:drug/metabolite transporter (DMT)-like permease